ncbi:hypothetical protein MAALD49_36810 [Marinobacter shengliensis]|nr:hypothetical protein MAALD49_36810 [Marinobacter shengliensis]
MQPEGQLFAPQGVITSECHRYQSALRFTNHQIPKAEKGVYQSADATEKAVSSFPSRLERKSTLQ